MDLLNLIQRQLIPRAVVELGTANRIVVRDALGVFDRAAVGKIGRDSCCPKRVAANPRAHTRRSCSTFDHPQHIVAVHLIQ